MTSNKHERTHSSGNIYRRKNKKKERKKEKNRKTEIHEYSGDNMDKSNVFVM